MAKAGNINVKVKMDAVQVNLAAWRIVAKYAEWCRVLMERNRKLDNKLRIRSARLGQERAYARDYQRALEVSHAQVRRLTQELAQAKQDAQFEADLRSKQTELEQLPRQTRQLQEMVHMLRRELEEKNNAAG